MNFLISANTDIGTTKQTNQDSLAVKILNTVQGRMVFAVLCDGMGGLANGEIASASLVHAFESWCSQELPKLCKAPLEDNVIRNQWEKIIDEMNQKIKVYGLKQGVRMGTTAVVMLLTDQRYYIINNCSFQLLDIAYFCGLFSFHRLLYLCKNTAFSNKLVTAYDNSSFTFF